MYLLSDPVRTWTDGTDVEVRVATCQLLGDLTQGARLQLSKPLCSLVQNLPVLLLTAADTHTPSATQ